MKMQESGENYLETILMLKEKKGEVRSIDIANELGFTKPSISRAVSLLKENGYIEVERGGHIFLTEKGEEIAKKMYERHRLLAEYLEALGVSHETALQDACRIEHVISEETFGRIKEQVGEK